jgi:superfamily II DNA or RNA helicase
MARSRTKKPESKTLWEHQRRAFDSVMVWIEDGSQLCTIIGRQGCGKTIITIALGAAQVDGNDGIKGVVFTAPLDTIVDNFAKHTDIQIPPGSNGKSKVLDISGWWTNSIVRGKVAKVSRETYQKFFRGVYKKTPFVALTHQSLRERFLSLPENLTGFILVLDEAHHAPLEKSKKQTVIGGVRDEWIRRGGVVVQTTATPWHTESGRLIYKREQHVYQISTADLAKAGIGPNKFEFSRVILPYTADTLREWLTPDHVDTRSLARAYKKIVGEWTRMDKPILLVRFPDNKHRDALASVFEHEGARVLDMTGDKLSKETLDNLHYNQTCVDHDKRTVDVILASRRFDEGTDLPLISTVFYIGSPISIRLIGQVWGRGMRDKKEIENYPTQYRRLTTIRFFVPKAADEIMEEYLELHHEDAIAMATYLSNYEVGYEVFEALQDKLRSALVNNREPQDAARHESVIQRFMLGEHDMNQHRADVRKIVAKIAAENDCKIDEVKPQDLARTLVEMPESPIRDRLERAFLLDLSASVSKVSDQIAFRMKRVVAKAQRHKDKIVETEREMRKEFHGLVEEIAGDWDHITKMTKSHDLVRVISRFTGLEAQKIEKALRDKAMPYPSRWDVSRAVRKYIDVNGIWVKASQVSAAKYGLTDYTWKQIDRLWPKFRLPGKGLEDYGKNHVEMF